MQPEETGTEGWRELPTLAGGFLTSEGMMTTPVSSAFLSLRKKDLKSGKCVCFLVVDFAGQPQLGHVIRTSVAKT